MKQLAATVLLPVRPPTKAQRPMAPPALPPLVPAQASAPRPVAVAKSSHPAA
jgi:hypothetical protein